VARLLREKGIHLYVEAAKALKSEFPNAEFHVIGASLPSPSALDPEHLQKLDEKGIVVFHGRQNRVQDFLHDTDVFVLPTYYREGIPRSILEALSVGMPIITTDSPGCRETITNYENGILVKPRDLNELEKAMRFFLENPAKIESMGLTSRKMAETIFDVNIINENLISICNSVLDR
jgi:glycosyltransferase involved in cell wall biosynthesis